MVGAPEAARQQATAAAALTLTCAQGDGLYAYPSHGYVERAAERGRWEAAVLADLDLYDSLQARSPAVAVPDLCRNAAVPRSVKERRRLAAVRARTLVRTLSAQFLPPFPCRPALHSCCTPRPLKPSTTPPTQPPNPAGAPVATAARAAAATRAPRPAGPRPRRPPARAAAARLWSDRRLRVVA
jgi:hypothetical protein